MPAYVFPMAGGRVVAVPDLADSVTIVDAGTLRPLGPPPDPGRSGQPAPVPDHVRRGYYHGDRIAVVNRAGTLQLYDVATRRPSARPTSWVPTVYAVFSRTWAPSRSAVAAGRSASSTCGPIGSGCSGAGWTTTSMRSPSRRAAT